jgi:hypothetical protein
MEQCGNCLLLRYPLGFTRTIWITACSKCSGNGRGFHILQTTPENKKIWMNKIAQRERLHIKLGSSRVLKNDTIAACTYLMISLTVHSYLPDSSFNSQSPPPSHSIRPSTVDPGEWCCRPVRGNRRVFAHLSAVYLQRSIFDRP